MIKHPIVQALIILSIAFALRYGLDTVNESLHEAKMKEKCGDPVPNTCWAPAVLPWAVTFLLPYVAAAAVGYFLLKSAPFAIILGLAGAAIAYLTLSGIGA